MGLRFSLGSDCQIRAGLPMGFGNPTGAIYEVILLQVLNCFVAEKRSRGIKK